MCSSPTSLRHRNGSPRPRSGPRRSPCSPNCCGEASPDEVEVVAAFAVGSTLHGRIGVGWSTLADVRPGAGEHADARPCSTSTGAVVELAGITGGGSVGRRRERLHELLAAATEPEQRLIVAVLGGELRQGALDGVMAAAAAKAAGVPLDDVRRAAMFSGSLPAAARIALTEGARGAGSGRPRPGTSGPADAGVGRAERRRRARRAPGPRRWSGSSTVLASKPTAPTVRFASSPATSTTSPIVSAAWCNSCGRCRAATSCSTARCSASPTRARRGVSRTRWVTSAPTPRSAARPRSGAPVCRRSSSTSCTPVRRSSTRRWRGVVTYSLRSCRARRACRRSSPPIRSRPSGSSTRRSRPGTKA